MLIKIEGLEDISNFYVEASKVDGEVTCRRGRYTVDGKSLLGMIAIDPSMGILVTYPKDAKDFENFISRFAILNGENEDVEDEN